MESQESTDEGIKLDEYTYTERDNFTSELYKAEISNLPFHITPKELKKVLINRLSVRAHKIKLFVINRSKFAFVTFTNSESRDKAIKAIDGFQYKQKTFNAKLAKPKADPVQRAKRETKERALPETDEPAKSILDIVLPWNAMPYADQLVAKQSSMIELMRKFANNLRRQQGQEYNRLLKKILAESKDRTPCDFQDICPSPRQTHYRNKNEFTVGRNAQNEVVVGFRKSSYRKGSIEVGSVSDEMLHIPPSAVAVAKVFEGFFVSKSDSRPPYNAETEEGYWRQLTVRTTEKGGCMAIVVMHPQKLTPEEIEAERRALAEFHREEMTQIVTSLYFQLFDKKGTDHPYVHLSGAEVIEEQLFDLSFKISPPSFFQVNTKGAEVLYERIADMAGVTETSTVLDLFCGTGSIGLSMARKVKRVIGAEIIPEAIENARAVAIAHGISNATFLTGKTEDVLPKALQEIQSESGEVVVILDPPRQGVHNRVVKLLRACPTIEKIVYVSCNPAAAVQNFTDFCKASSNNYRGEEFVPVTAQAVDMFPHTPHTELVVVLQRLKSVEERFSGGDAPASVIDLDPKIEVATPPTPPPVG